MPDPLPIENWRSRWMQFGRGSKLHRLAEAAWDDPTDLISGDGVAVCGRRGRFYMPGLFSRMGAARCPACCLAVGIMAGDGAPFNALEGEAANV